MSQQDTGPRTADRLAGAGHATGRRAHLDDAVRLGVRAAAAAADHRARPAGRRRHRQPDRRADAAALGRGPAGGHRALHQLAGRFGDRRDGHLRHDGVHRVRRGDLRDGPGRLDGAVPALGGDPRQALRAAALPDPHAPALGGRRRHRVRHRDPGRAVHAAQAGDGRADRRAHRPDRGADHRRLRPGPLVLRAGGPGVRLRRPRDLPRRPAARRDQRRTGTGAPDERLPDARRQSPLRPARPSSSARATGSRSPTRTTSCSRSASSSSACRSTTRRPTT